MSIDRSEYIKFCEEVQDIPIFMESWFLNALAPGWQAAAIKKGDKVIAVWPYYPKKKGFLRMVAMPRLVRFMGPYFHPDHRDTSHLYKLIPELWDQFSDIHILEQQAHYTLDNWLPLYWLQFQQTTRYSYHINLLDEQETIWQNIKPKYRNNQIPKAKETVDIEASDDIESFLRLQKFTYERQNLTFPIPDETIRALYQTLKARNRGKIMLAKDRNTGQAYSAIMMIWDRDNAYFLLGGNHPEGRPHFAGIYLTWATIAWAKEQGFKTYDFLGSMIPNIEIVRRHFGAIPKPYFHFTYFRNPWLRWIYQWRRLRK